MSAPTQPTTDLEKGTGATAVATAPPASARRRGLLGALPPAVVLLVLAFVPFFLAEDPVNILTRILVFGLFAVSLDLLVGITGLPSLGHAAYFGVGAYAAALVAEHWTPSAPTPVLMAAGCGAVAAVLTGWLAVRMHGVFFLMLTLAIGEITSQLALQLDDVTGGSNGMSVSSVRFGSEPFDADFRIAYTYWYVLVVFVIGFAAMWLIARSPFGLALRGIRDNEARMRSLGYTPFRYKYVAFILAGGFAGLAGGLFAQVNRLVSPVDAGFALSAITLLALVLGGAGTLWGPILGMALVVIVRDYYGPDLNGHGPLLLGIVFVIAVYVLPRGFAGIAGTLRGARRRPRSIVPGEERSA